MQSSMLETNGYSHRQKNSYPQQDMRAAGSGQRAASNESLASDYVNGSAQSPKNTKERDWKNKLTSRN